MVKFNVLKGLYETEQTIGCGGFAKVKLATHIATGEKVAIKIMEKTMLKDDLHRVYLEMAALKNLYHENICQLYQVLETDTHFFLIMEHCSGGELFDHIVEKKRLTEAESRTFFLQIVSAVGYLHSLGYAHRDIKPENILLDRNQNLKLIDFGLCAKPEAGMQSPLYTSCGSPTYAAPELVMGQQYLGQEVDVWAMGVLLYALLAGSLPFDDDNINNLYRKILSGKYDEPSFISKNSKSLIRSMLQVDPKKRIKMSELSCHPWVTLMGIFSPVKGCAQSKMELDRDCVKALAKYLDVDESVVKSDLEEWKYDYSTVTYFLLLTRKKRGKPLKLNPACAWKQMKNPEQLPLIELPTNPINSHLTPNGPIKIRRKFGVRSPKCLSPSPSIDVDTAYSPGQFLDAKSDNYCSRKGLKRPRSPLMDEASPVPSKKATPAKTPDRKNLGDTPGSARRMLGSIEKSFHRVRHVLTPKKPYAIQGGPAVLNSKDLCNVSTTQCKDPEYVIVELCKGLEGKGITCTRKGFRIKGSLEPSSSNRLGGCSFELEICYLPHLGVAVPNQTLTPSKSILKQGIIHNQENISIESADTNGNSYVGIKRKRLKGDSWCYKKVCEQVLALTCTGFKNNGSKEMQLLESAV